MKPVLGSKRKRVKSVLSEKKAAAACSETLGSLSLDRKSSTDFDSYLDKADQFFRLMDMLERV